MGKLTMEEVIGHCERTVERFEKQMSREALEKRPIEEIFMKEYWEHRQVAEWLEELQALKDKQEQGLLIELPVPEGTTVYIFEDDCSGDVCDCNGDCENCASHSKYVDEIEFDCGLLHAWGKWVFATRSEAEEALAKMGGK